MAWGRILLGFKVMSIEAKLKELGLELPEAPTPAGNYVPAVRTGNLVYLSGVLAWRDGAITHAGPVGEKQTVESAYEAARVCVLNALANLKAAMGDLTAVRRIVMVNGYVYAVDGFTESPKVINGASDLIGELFGDKGKHARAAVAVNGLPLGSAVELQIVVEVEG